MFFATALLAAAAAAAPPATPTPLALLDPAKGTVTFTWEQLRTGNAVVSIVNPNPAAQKAEADLAPFHPDAAQGRPLEWRQRHFSLDTPGFGVARVHLDPADAPAAAGGYSGFLTVTQAGVKAPVAIQIHIVGTSALPLPPKLTVTLTREIPFTTVFWSTDVRIPFIRGTLPRPAAAGLVGALTNDSGGWIGVHPAEEPKDQERVFRIDPPSEAGTYRGDLTFASGADKGVVTLTVLAQDLIFWPVLVIALGTLMAYGVKRYLGVRRIVLILREQEAELGGAFRKSEAQFSKDTSGKPYGAYTIHEAVDAKRREILDLLAKIEMSKLSSLDNNPDYTNALDRIQKLAAAIASWGAFGGELNRLSAALDAVRKAAPPAASQAPLKLDPLPRFFNDAQALLAGKTLRDIAELDPLRQKVDAAAVLAEGWKTALDQTLSVTESFNETQGDSGVRNQLIDLWRDLWQVNAQTDLDGVAKSGGEIDTVRHAVDHLAPKQRMAAPSFIFQPEITAGGVVAHALATHSPASDERRAELARQSIQFGDTLSILFAGLIALLTALNLYYVGKPFGTVGDYLTVFLWAARHEGRVGYSIRRIGQAHHARSGQRRGEPGACHAGGSRGMSHFQASDARRAISSPMASDAVAPGLGALSTCSASGRAISRKSCSSSPPGAIACARTPEPPGSRSSG